MRSTATRNSGRLLALVACVTGAGLSAPAWGHPQGFHKKLTFTLTKTKVTGLVVMDVDSGERCALLRQPFDADRNGLLEGDEVTRLKERLVKLASSRLELGLSGAPLPFAVKDVKVSLRDDKRANDAALSVALLIEVVHPRPVSEGLELEVTDTSPDTSTIVLQVFQAGVEAPPFQAEVPSGVKAKVRLGRLTDG